VWVFVVEEGRSGPWRRSIFLVDKEDAGREDYGGVFPGVRKMGRVSGI